MQFWNLKYKKNELLKNIKNKFIKNEFKIICLFSEDNSLII